MLAILRLHLISELPFSRHILRQWSILSCSFVKEKGEEREAKVQNKGGSFCWLRHCLAKKASFFVLLLAKRKCNCSAQTRTYCCWIVASIMVDVMLL